jgi:hypothetical protein
LQEKFCIFIEHKFVFILKASLSFQSKQFSIIPQHLFIVIEYHHFNWVKEEVYCSCVTNTDSGTWRFNTVYTKAYHWTWSQATSVHLESSLPPSLKFILMLSSHLLGLPSGHFPSAFHTRILYAVLLSPPNYIIA